MGELCDRYGLDTISLSNCIGLAFLLFERGHLAEEDTGGVALRWGDMQVVEQLIHLTARREAFGERLAQGAKALAERQGVPELAAQVKGLEVAYHDPRGASGMALVYATSPRGACHNQGDYYLVDIGQVEESLDIEMLPIRAGAEKAANVARHQDWRSLGNAIGLCSLASVPPEVVLHLVNLATGFDFDLETLLRVGARGWNLKRVINYRLGSRKQDDRLPEILLTPLEDGPAAGYVPPIDEMLAAYYQARGWDEQRGIPTRETLADLGLKECIAEVWSTPDD